MGLLTRRAKFNETLHSLKEHKQKLKQLKQDLQEHNQKLDFLNYQKEEIEACNLEEGQEAQLENTIEKLKNSQSITQFIENSESDLYSSENSCLTKIHNIIQNSQPISSYFPELKQAAENLEQAKDLIEEYVYDLRSCAQSISSNPQELLLAQEKLSQIRKLQKKYGKDIPEILETLQVIKQNLTNLKNSESLIAHLEKDITTLEQESQRQASGLHNSRIKGKSLLEESVNKELEDLNMKGQMFYISLTQRETMATHGYSQVEFQMYTNTKDAAKPIIKFASGGELSRILLALKHVIGFDKSPKTFVFDEVDAGVSGETAQKVGHKLKSIAQGQQVICVTHLPQVAAFSNTHIFIQKKNANGLVNMLTKTLTASEKVQELARLLSGETISPSSLENAKVLLEQSVF